MYFRLKSSTAAVLQYLHVLQHKALPITLEGCKVDGNEMRFPTLLCKGTLHLYESTLTLPALFHRLTGLPEVLAQCQCLRKINEIQQVESNLQNCPLHNEQIKTLLK